MWGIVYINYVFLFSVSWRSAIWGLSDQGKTALPGLGNSYRQQMPPLWARLSYANQLILSSHPQLPPLSGSHHQTTILCSNLPQSGTRQLGTTPTAQSPPKLFKLSNLKPAQLAYPALSSPSYENHSKAHCPCFPLLLLPPADLVLPVEHDVPLLLGTMSDKLFSKIMSFDLITYFFAFKSVIDFIYWFYLFFDGHHLLIYLPDHICNKNKILGTF